MAIQYRRGQFSDFDPSKLKPGEPAVVLSGDPDSTDGQSVYFCFNAGNVKRMATYNDMVQNIQSATQEIQQQFTSELESTLQDAENQLSTMQTATQSATNAASSANQAASNASQATAAFEEAAAGTIINDDTPSDTTVYSSNKVESLIGDPLQTSDIINNLTSTETEKPLSANMGRNLNNTKLDKTGDGSNVTATFQQTSTRQNIATGDTLAEMCGKIAKYLSDLKSAAFASTNDILLSAYPVGSIYLSVNNTNPGTLFGGTWVRWGNGRVPVGVDTSQTEFNAVEKTGGEKQHILTVEEIPEHTHEKDVSGTLVNNAITGLQTGGNFWNVGISNSGDHSFNIRNTGGGKAHNNLQPYITCYMWKRTV